MNEDIKAPTRSQDEINQEYSHYAVLYGDRNFKKTMAQKQIDFYDSELLTFGQKMEQLVLEKAKPKPLFAQDSNKDSQAND